MGDAQVKEPLQPNDKNSSSGSINRPSSPLSQEFGYEELSNGLTCPTCQGTGKIPRGQEDDLVALIPYRDDRLKPRRTALYVCLAVFICMAIAGTLCAFLIPRPISFVDDSIDTISANLTHPPGEKRKLLLNLMNNYNVSNENFLSLSIINVTMQVVATFKGHVINDQQKGHPLNLDIPLRTKSQQFKVPVNVNVTDDDFPLEFCDKAGPSHGIYMIFQTTIYYQYLFRDSQSSLTHYQLVSCINPPGPEEPPYNVPR